MRSRPKERRRTLGKSRGVAGAGTVADVVTRMAGWGPKVGAEGADEGGAGGGDELFLEVGGVGGQAAEEVGGGGRGDGEVAVGAVDHAAADVERGAVPVEGLAGIGEGLLVEVVDAGGGGDDVDDGVDGSDLVEVDLVDGDVVDFGFGGAEELEGVDGEVFDGLGEGGVADEVADDGEGAAVGCSVRADARARGGARARGCSCSADVCSWACSCCGVLVLVAGLVEMLCLGLGVLLVRVLVFGLVRVWVGVRVFVRVARGDGLRRGGRFRGRGPWWR